MTQTPRPLAQSAHAPSPLTPRPLTRAQYEAFVAPRSIAIVGATQRTGPQGYNLVENLVEIGCACRIYPVNPRATEIAGRRAYGSVSEIPEVVDLAVISTPREAVPGAVAECVARGIPALIVVTQGFTDADEQGHRLQAEVDRVLQGSATRLLGPNTIGVANVLDGFHTSFQRFDLVPNGVAWLCQSGIFVLGSLDFSGGLGIGLDVGNAADVGMTELLPWLAADPRIGVINIHMEGIGDGRGFLDAVAAITPHKPVVVLKTGRSEAGARAAISHTGSLAGEDRVFDAAFRKAGAIRATSGEEVADLDRALLCYPRMSGRRIGIVTISGGAGIAAVDALEAAGLEPAALSPRTLDGMQTLFPAWFEIGNPVDFWPAAMRGGYRETCDAILDLLLADAGVDAVLFVIAAYRATGLEVIGPVIESIAAKAATCRAKPVAFWVFGGNQDEAIAALEKTGVVAGFTSPERAARALAGVHRGRNSSPPRTTDCGAGNSDMAHARRVLAEFAGRAPRAEQAAPAGSPRVLGAATLDVLAAAGIAVAPVRLATRETAAAVARDIGYPLVMKVASADIVHKSDVGGVRLGIRDEAQLLAAFDAMMEAIERAAPAARIDGVHLQRQHEGGTELIVGCKRDPVFGPVVLLGSGGIHAEVLKDVTCRLAPLSRDDAREMIDELRSRPLLHGARGAPPADIDAIVDCLLGVSRLVVACPEIAELDLNPVIAQPEGAIALDARAVLAG